MVTVRGVARLRAAIDGWRRDGLRVVLVPTMGNLHAGHLRLVARARELGDRIVTSIFVNPLQFGPAEDYADYPRTLQADCKALEQARCDLVYAPDADEMYPHGTGVTRISVGALGGQLCGAHRIGHFDGMATVVVKLLNQVRPDAAVFGRKDYQQLAVIRQVVRDLDLAVAIHSVDTVREADGLAMSSRNRYLTADERALAPLLYRTLQGVADALAGGDRDFARLTQRATEALRDAGFDPDYVAIRMPDLSLPDDRAERVVILGAARLGEARLIDNLTVPLVAA